MWDPSFMIKSFGWWVSQSQSKSLREHERALEPIGIIHWDPKKIRSQFDKGADFPLSTVSLF